VLTQFHEVKRADRIDDLVEWLMGALLVFTPLAFGTTEAWSREIFLIIAAGTVFCLAIKLVAVPTARFFWSWFYVPIGLFLLLAAGQLLPLPRSVLKVIAPGTADLRAQLLSDVPNAASVLGRQTISLYPAATRWQLWLVLGVAAIFVVVVNVYRDRLRIQRLLTTIVAAGALVAALALYQNLTGATTVYGIVPAIHRNSGPFMNYSHFSQFMNLSVGAALGLVLMRRSQSWFGFFLAIFCVLGPITVFLSMSRMGVISLLAASAFTAGMLARQKRVGGKRSLILWLGVAVLAILLVTGFDAVYSRLATLRHVELAEGGRLQMLKDMTREFRQFPILGTGLGTHEFVFPMFDHSTIAQIATHAEDEYAQLMEECGSVGLGLAALFLVMGMAAYFRAASNSGDPVQYAVFGLGFGLIAILVHSATDFGQHVPANAVLTAVFFALLVNLSRISADEPIGRPTRASAGLRLAGRYAALAVVASLAVWMVKSADLARRAEAQWGKAADARVAIEASDWQGSPDDYIALLTPAAAAASLEPDDVTYQYWLNVYRWHAISTATDPATHQTLLTPLSLSFASKIAGQLESLRALCPTYGPPLCVAGQIEFFALHRPEGAGHIETAYRLTPYDPTVCFVAGTLAIQQGDWPKSLVALRRCQALGGFEHDILDLYVHSGRPDLAYELSRGNRQDLQYLATVLGNDPASVAIAAHCRDEAMALLESEARRPDAVAGTLAELADAYRRTGHGAQAIAWYRKALDLDYGRVDWRLQLANALASQGQTSDAIREARICLNLHPESKDAQDLLSELSSSP
jgi:tetratricopeptide (TPR) repeat protein